MTTRRFLSVFMTLVFAIVLAPSAASAGQSFMSLGERTNQPIGHHEFCLTQPAECSPGPAAGDDAVELSAPLIGTIAKINMSVNAKVRPASDRELYGVEERWAYPGEKGDCEDYVLLKRQRLIEAGLAPSHVLITVVRKRSGDGHAVLTLRTSVGDFILDNLDWRVRPWFETPYTFIKRQSSSHPGRWVAIETSEDLPVASLTN